MVVFSISLPRLDWRRTFRVAATFFCAFAILGPLLAQDAGAQNNPERQRTPLVVTTGEGAFRFDVEIADTPELAGLGLMFRREMAPDRGMLFIFGDTGERSFWMENTFISLDIIFIRPDGTVLSVAENTVPFSRASIPSNGPARYVLELIAGSADRIGLQPGDQVEHDRITAAD